MDAEAVLTALHVAGLPVIGVCVVDPADPATWRFDGDLTAAERAQAILVVQEQILVAATSPLRPTPIATLDQVIAWQAGKLGIAIDQAVSEITTQPAVYVPPTKEP